MKKKLDALIAEMIAGGIRFTDARLEFEKRFVSQVLELENGNLTRAAKVLDIHRNTLRSKIDQFKLRRKLHS